MIHMIVKWCCVMDKPADQSEFYRTICELYDKETADRYTYEQIIPPLEDVCTTGSSNRSMPYGDMVGV
jgi:hypothetical protein